MDTSSSMHEWPDFVPVAESLGCDAIRIQTVEDYDAAEKMVKERVPGRPVFIEVAIDPDVASSLPH